MVICPKCAAVHDVDAFSICECGYEKVEHAGITIWHSFLSGINYELEGFDTLNAHEPEHFWFIARSALVTHCLNKYFFNAKSILDVGCGTGFVLSKISGSFPEARLFGSDVFIEALRFAAVKLKRKAAFMQMDARKIPYTDEFDVILACDVLEHINEDELVLENFYRSLRQDGGLVLTVPQHPWLWSTSDDKASHVRRYAVSELSDKVEKAGFTILLNTSFVSLLLPALMASRLPAKRDKNPQGNEFLISTRLNSVFAAIMRLEYWLITRGVRFPAGGSRLVVARKIKNGRNLA